MNSKKTLSKCCKRLADECKQHTFDISFDQIDVICEDYCALSNITFCPFCGTKLEVVEND